MKITQITADFTSYPDYNPERLGLERDTSRPQEMTLGDLSGNLLMLMWVQMTAGMAKMSRENYAALVALQQEISASHEAAYVRDAAGKKKMRGATPKKEGTPYMDFNKVSGLTPDQQKRWEDILNKTTFVKSNTRLILEGDELGDRRDSDNQMIDTLDEMARQHVSFTIIASNHLHLFVQYFLSKKQVEEDDEEEEEETYDDLVTNGQGASLLHMLASIKNGTVSDDDIRDKIARVYPGRLHLFAYSLTESPTHIVLYAHAPFDLQSMVDAAEYLNIPVPAQFNHATEVATFIDAINEAFDNIYTNVYFSRGLKEALPELSEKAEQFGSTKNPIGALLWMKDYTKVTNRPTPACFQKITVELRHGHTDNPEPRLMENRFSLNSDSAQPDNNYTFAVASGASVGVNDKATVSKGYFFKYAKTETGNGSPTVGTLKTPKLD